MKKREVISVLLGILTSVVLGMVLLTLQGYNPFEIYQSIFSYGLFTSFGLTNTLNRMGILLLTSTSAAFALRSGVSNLGQFGQLLIGGIVAVVIGIYIDLPAIILIPLMMLSSMLAGAFYSGIAAVFKKRFGMDEFIITLMLNFIANLFTSYLVAFPLLDPASSWPMSQVIPENLVLPSIGNLDSSFIISMIVVLIMIVYVKTSKDGYETKIIGNNPFFAKYGGVKTNKQFLKVMLISGALAGLAGCLMIIGPSQQNRFLVGLGQIFGDDGLMVSIVSNNNIALSIVYSLIFSVLQSSSTVMQMDTGVPSEFTVMLIAITVLSVVAFRAYSSTFMNKLEMKSNERKLRQEDKNGNTNRDS